MKKKLSKLQLRQVKIHKKAYDKARYDFLKWANVKSKKEYMTGMIKLLRKQEKLDKKSATEKAEKMWRYYVDRATYKYIFTLDIKKV